MMMHATASLPILVQYGYINRMICWYAWLPWLYMAAAAAAAADAADRVE